MSSVWVEGCGVCEEVGWNQCGWMDVVCEGVGWGHCRVWLGGWGVCV